MRVNTYRNKITPQIAPQEGPESTATKDPHQIGDTVSNTAGDTVAHQVAHQVTPQVLALLGFLEIPRLRADLIAALDKNDRINFIRLYLRPALSTGLIERTIPDKPTSRFQKYRLTDKGREALAKDETSQLRITD